MIVDDDVVGVLSLWRYEVDPFDERAAEVMEAFAAQAAIALKNVALLGALESRTAELATKVDELESLREVGDAVSSILDLDEVLQTVVTHAVRITGTDGGSIMEYIEEDDAFSVRAAYGTSASLLDALRGVRIERDSTLVGRAALQRRPLSSATSPLCRSTRTCGSFMTTAGVRYSPYPCSAGTGWWVRW